MDATGLRQCTPRNRDSSVRPEPALNFTSTYVVRALANLPKQGSKVPWRLYQNYVRDLLALRFARVDDGVMQFTNPLRAHDAATISSLPPRAYERAGDYDQPQL
jgi:hypothetical protein